MSGAFPQTWSFPMALLVEKRPSLMAIAFISTVQIRILCMYSVALLLSGSA
jgi:hypothetical protein